MKTRILVRNQWYEVESSMQKNELERYLEYPNPNDDNTNFITYENLKNKGSLSNLVFLFFDRIVELENIIKDKDAQLEDYKENYYSSEEMNKIVDNKIKESLSDTLENHECEVMGLKGQIEDLQSELNDLL